MLKIKFYKESEDLKKRNKILVEEFLKTLDELIDKKDKTLILHKTKNINAKYVSIICFNRMKNEGSLFLYQRKYKNFTLHNMISKSIVYLKENGMYNKGPSLYD